MALETRNSKRYVSIDLLRGTALILMLLVSSRSPLPQLRHGSWNQVTLADLVYPCFLLLIGVSMALSSRSRAAAYYPKLIRRVLGLFFIGVALTALGSGRLGLCTLQSIAIASLLTVPVARSGWQTILAYLVFCISAQLLVFAAFADPGMMWAATGSAAEKLDLILLGKYRGVEGVLGSLFSGLFVLLGLLVGATLVLPARERLRYCVALASTFVVIGLCSRFLLAQPVVPRLISPSFFFLTGASLIAVASLAFHLLQNNVLIQPLRPIARIGENPLAIFCGVKLFQDLVLRIQLGPTSQQLSELIRDFVRGNVNESLGLASTPLIKVCVAFLIAEYLAKKQLRLRL